MNPNASISRWRPIDLVRGSVVVRLFIVVFVFSCVVTVVLTAVQLGRDYWHGVELVQRRLSEADSIYRDSLAEALWRLDRSQLRLELEGMLRLDDISAVQVREVGTDPLVESVGQPAGAAAAIVRDFPIVRDVQGTQRQIGTLHVEATLAGLSGSGAHGTLVQVVDPAEESFPYSGRVEFVEPEGFGVVTAGRAESWAQDYTARLALHRDQIRAETSKLDWLFTTHATDRSAAELLLFLHAGMQVSKSGARPTIIKAGPAA